jgi:WD40 repeat protein
MLKLLFLAVLLAGLCGHAVHAEDHTEVKRLWTLYTPASDLAWNDSGTVIITAARGTIRVWDGETLQQRYLVRHSQDLNGIAFHPDGERFLTWSNAEIRVWETTTGRLLGQLQAPSNSRFKGMVWHDSGILNWFGAVIGLWDGSALENTASVYIPDDSFLPHHASVSWNQARTRFLTWNAVGVDVPIVRVWAVSGALDSITQIMTLPHEDERIDGAAWSPDETRIVSWSQRRVNVWDAETAALLHVINTDSYVTDARWSPNSRYLLVEDIRESAARIWDVYTGAEIRTLPGTDALWDTTGDRLLVGRQRIRLLDVTTGADLAAFPADFRIGFAVWNPDGIRLLVRSASGLQVWIIPPVDQCVIHTRAAVNLRTEPRIDAPRVEVLQPRRLLPVVGQAIDDTGAVWWQLGDNRWVRSDVVEVSGRCDSQR